MKRAADFAFFRTLVGACAAIVFFVPTAQAETILPGIPSGPILVGTGFNLSADWADPDDVEDTVGGATAGAGFLRYGVLAGAGTFQEEISYGGGVAMRVFGGGALPVDLTAQLSGWTVDVSGTRVSAFNPALAARASVVAVPLKPWGLAYYRMAKNGEEELRATVGADLNLIFGLGAHGGYDFGDSGNTWGLGAHFQFGVPVPGV
jgi:hypothetical protein